jgi:Mrp family chromosome partitioning ATPase
MERAKALQNFIQYSEIKSLLDRIIHLQETEKFQSLAVLSELDGEGKTFITAVLAHAYTERVKKKALVVDASNSGSGSAVPVQAASRQRGDLLSELLEESALVDVISLRDWGGAKTDADEYQLKTLFAQTASKYGLILVDTSALSRRNRNNFDPFVIARQCEASVLLSARSDVPQDISVENRKRIFDSKIKLIGMIFNHGEGAKRE